MAFRDFAEYRVIVQRTKMLDDQEHPDQESEIADTVNDKSFLACVGGGVLEKEKADQQVGSQSDALPAHEHQQIIVRQDQSEHKEHEEIQVRKEAIVTAFMPHVADGVNVNQETDARNYQHHNHRELVKIETERRRETAGC